MLLVHVVPHRRRASQAEADEKSLDSLVHPDLSRQGVVAPLVLQPAAPSPEDAEHDDRERLEKSPGQGEEVDSEREDGGELDHAKDDVRRARLEETLQSQLLSEFLERLEELLLLLVNELPGAREPLGEGLQNELSLPRPHMKLFESLGRVRAQAREHVVDNVAPGMLEVRDVVLSVLDSDVLSLCILVQGGSLHLLWLGVGRHCSASFVERCSRSGCLRMT